MFGLGGSNPHALGDAEPPPEHERIAAFWSVVVLCNYWSVAHSPVAGAAALHGDDVDTPWPQDPLQPSSASASASKDWMFVGGQTSDWAAASAFGDAEYTVFNEYDVPVDVSYGGMDLNEPSSMVLPQYQSAPASSSFPNPNGPRTLNPTGSPISRFLGGEADAAFSGLALLAKASILLERAAGVASRCNGFVRNDTTSTGLVLDTLIDSFTASLSSPDALSVADVLPHLLARTATLRLHLPHLAASDLSRRKCRAAVRAVVVLSAATRSNTSTPILSVLWSTAIDTLLAEFAVALQTGGEAGDAVRGVEGLLGCMRSAGARSPLVEYFANRAQGQYDQLNAMYLPPPGTGAGFAAGGAHAGR